MDLRKGLVLGGESLWNKVRELVAKAEGDEEVRWRRQADGEAAARAIESLVQQEADRRLGTTGEWSHDLSGMSPSKSRFMKTLGIVPGHKLLG